MFLFFFLFVPPPHAHAACMLFFVSPPPLAMEKPYHERMHKTFLFGFCFFKGGGGGFGVPMGPGFLMAPGNKNKVYFACTHEVQEFLLSASHAPVHGGMDSF